MPTHNIAHVCSLHAVYLMHYIQQEQELQSSRREIADLQQQLQASKTLLAKEVREKASLVQEVQRKNAELGREMNKGQRIAEKDAQLARIQEANKRSISQLQGQIQTQQAELKQLKQKVSNLLHFFAFLYKRILVYLVVRSSRVGWKLLSYSSSFNVVRLCWRSF